ncbi:hypothetical protein GIB67_039686 [Kingdonia uniflora]|uniref:Uncharacterized protein n=1 Tax=Kingdonia uniflora TaxID=39325 RepID=A0A7J7MPR1_9MAGN|nr:hypothetical protein GIB67_039686 [Kingdonia uniflora]
MASVGRYKALVDLLQAKDRKGISHAGFRKDCDRYEIVPIQDPLSFEKGFFIVIRACQLLAQKNDRIILVGVAGPFKAGKTVFIEKVLNYMPSIAVISMDNCNDASRIIDGNFDDPHLTDYDTLLENIHGLKEGKPIEVPINDFKSSCRIDTRLSKFRVPGLCSLKASML